MYSIRDLVGGELKWQVLGNASFLEHANRTSNCVLNQVGKPVYQHYHDLKFGAWLRDLYVENSSNKILQPDTPNKIFFTSEADYNHLYEYRSKAIYRNSNESKKHKLPCPARGNAHIVYNENFYYLCQDSLKIIRYDLRMDKEASNGWKIELKLTTF